MNVPAPPSIESLGVTKQLHGQAGDLWLIAGSTMVGMQPWAADGPPRLVGFEYAGRASIISNGDIEPPAREYPAW